MDRFTAFIKDYEDDSKLTSVSFQVLPDYWQGTLNMPIEELRLFSDAENFSRIRNGDCWGLIVVS